MQTVNSKKGNPAVIIIVIFFVFLVQIVTTFVGKFAEMGKNAYEHNVEIVSAEADEIGKTYEGDSVDGYTYYRVILMVKNNGLKLENVNYISVGFDNEDEYYCSAEREGKAPSGEEQKYRDFTPVVPAGRTVPIAYIVRVPDGSSKIVATVRDNYCIGTPSSATAEL